MNEPDIGAELARLSSLYSTYSDSELLELDPGELTESAEAVRTRELERRGLSAEPAPIPKCDAPIRLVVWQGRSPLVADVAASTLNLAGISAVTSADLGERPARRFRVSVPSRDAERALDLLAGTGIEELATELMEELKASDFVPPDCTECRTDNCVLLPSVSETLINRWMCEKCGHVWSDDPSAPTTYDSQAREEAGPQALSIEGATTVDRLARRRLFRNRVQVFLTAMSTIALVFVTSSAPWTPSKILTLCALAIAETLWCIARWQLGSSFTSRAEAHRLVTHGLYSRVQNPIYIFGGLTTVGLLVVIGLPYVAAIAAFIVAILQIGRIRRERKVLLAAFGREYEIYRRRTWF